MGRLQFEREPLAAASLGQVHRAVLGDGRMVVVKVQRPDIRTEIFAELEILQGIAEFLENRTTIGKRYRFVSLVEEFGKTLIAELDYEREASNLCTLGKNLEQFQHIHVPRPVEALTTRSVLTMEYVQGTKITELSEALRQRLDAKLLAGELFDAYLKQILLDGIFHADPHPGNVFIPPSNPPSWVVG